MLALAEVARVVLQLGAGTFAGACLYIALVQHPVRRTLAVPAAVVDFRETIPRAERLQAPLLVVSLLAAVVTLLLLPTWTVLAGALLLLAVLVQTVATVLPINRRLLSGSPEDHHAEGAAELGRWGRLHAVRTVVAVAAAVLVLVPAG